MVNPQPSPRPKVSTTSGTPLTNVRDIMWHTNAALVPGLVVAVYYFGLGYLQNLTIAITAGVLFEALALHLRGRDWRPQTTDGSVVLTCVLIALAAPPALSPYALIIACAFAVLLAKHSYGGIGRNLFNPAMVGYAAALICFPAAFAAWPIPNDGVTAATALEAIKTLDGTTMSDRLLAQNGFGTWGGFAAEWMGLAFAAGGGYLMWRKIVAWRVSLGFLLVLTLCAALGYDNGSSTTGGSPAQHLLSGGTLLAAFFVLTDPVTHPSRARAQWVFGALVAALTYAIRLVGAYPDGIAFAVLLANGATPLLNQWAARNTRKTQSAKNAAEEAQ